MLVLARAAHLAPFSLLERRRSEIDEHDSTRDSIDCIIRRRRKRKEREERKKRGICAAANRVPAPDTNNLSITRPGD